MSTSTQRTMRWLMWLVLLAGPSGLPLAAADDIEDADATILRVGSQNLLHDFPNYYKIRPRMDRVATEIRNLKLDIVGFQESARIDEVGFVPAEIAQLLGYHYAYFDLELAGRVIGFKNGISIVSRYPILEQERLAFKHQKTIFEARAVIRALIQTPHGLVNFYSTHLSGDSDRLNLKQTRELVAFIDKYRGDGPAILAGDFNFSTTTSGSRYLAELGYVDTFRVANPGRNNATCCTCIAKEYHNWFDACPEKSFLGSDDRVYLIPGRMFRGEVLRANFMMWSPFQYGGKWLWASDHKGIESQIRLSSRPVDLDPRSLGSDP